MNKEIKNYEEKMNSKEINEMIEYPNQGIISKNLFKEEGFDVGLFCMAKGTDMSDHTSAKRGIVYVVEGKGVFNLEGEDIEMKPGMIIYLKKGALHSLKAEEDTAFILSLI